MYQFGPIEAQDDAPVSSLWGQTQRRRADGRRRAEPARHETYDATRLVDIAVAILVLIFAAPLMLAIALAVRLEDGGPSLFGHVRVGRDGRPFRCLKFRSMAPDAEVRLKALLAADPVARAEWEKDQKLRSDPRITRLGRFLRTSSLDELPQVLNVLRGDMSIVGPRPIIQAEIVRYGRAFRHYCAVRPGITGIWQVSGRNNVSYGRRVAMDALYARRKSLGVYLAVILKTIPAVLRRDGSY